jgi:methyl-accepting chemotaxis protein
MRIGDETENTYRKRQYNRIARITVLTYRYNPEFIVSVLLIINRYIYFKKVTKQEKNKMGLRLKILSGFLTLSMMLFIAGIWSFYELRSVGTSVQKMLDENYKSINAAKMMLEALEREDSAILLLILGKWEEGRTIIASGDSLFQQGFQIANNNLTIPGEKAYLDSIETRYNRYKTLWERPIVGTEKEGDLNWYFQQIQSRFLDVKGAVNGLMDLNDHVMFQTASELRNKANRTVMPGIVTIISALVFTLIFNYFVNYYMVSPIVKITDSLKKFNDNNSPFDVHIETSDEFSDLVSEINSLCARVNTGERDK